MRQNSNTRHLVHDVPRLIGFTSSFYSLDSGDVIMTGTPAGVSSERPGDVTDLEIERVGRMQVKNRAA